MKEITRLAEAQAAERVEAALAALASIENAITQMKIARQSALDELYAAIAAKAKINGNNAIDFGNESQQIRQQYHDEFVRRHGFKSGTN